ncbi:hypothetical protein [Streptomyces sp. NRRL F-5135]|uniref:hypothetical protein n=1 Tax=Streptomyces sp. NRRL F-5135 TaxID=1463858 RepID=UPI00068A6885|nr:hypothetical protein [Streptomyces sp. NRRL F-5135]
MSCTICPRPATDGTYACPACTRELRAWLAELPAQVPLLRNALLPEGRPAQGRISARASAPVPVNLDALNLLGPGQPDPPEDPYGDTTGPIPVRALVSGWAGYIAYEHQAVSRDSHGTVQVRPCDGAHASHGATIDGWCRWLTAYLPYAVTRPWIRGLHTQIGDLIHRIRTLTHATPYRRRMALPCPECSAFALTETSGQWGVTCEVCGNHLDPEQYDAHVLSTLATYTAQAQPAPESTAP